jgi:hypothetical protein
VSKSRGRKARAQRQPRPQPRVNDAGKVRYNFAKPQQGYVDQDYWDKLTPEQTRWLANFNDAYYGGDFRRETQEAWPQELRRKVWQNKHAALEDAYGQAAVYGAVQVYSETSPRVADPRSTPADIEPTPEYLNSAEYKEARDAFRQTLAPTRAPAPPVPSKRHDHTRLVLAMVTPANGTDTPSDDE